MRKGRQDSFTSVCWCLLAAALICVWLGYKWAKVVLL